MGVLARTNAAPWTRAAVEKLVHRREQQELSGVDFSH